ncbi:hemerythrin domain-containing protein [Actinopolymorpha pittospori]|uniref:Hemerythrin superfamily protein n=1 Tax=Actinopolymorpha pittospori TaxID=648752 RepID=A0A927MR23_9ACTN|nr:hemerythrin domain-containing protein [Actinopolymorpha pittospori]MBE1604672.1 hemerythrin superfamily protein [Actinopolymorpha pittospori]
MSDVVDLIIADHRELERLFEVLENEPGKRALTLPVVTALLVAHSRAEEAEVYPVARSEARETDEVAHSQEEHAEAEELLEKLQGIDPAAAEFGPALNEFVKAVRHHIGEEESDVLPGIRERIGDARRAELGAAFAASRQAHLGEAPGEETKAELLQQAKNAGIAGASSMSKEDLTEALKPE